MLRKWSPLRSQSLNEVLPMIVIGGDGVLVSANEAGLEILKNRSQSEDLGNVFPEDRTDLLRWTKASTDIASNEGCIVRWVLHDRTYISIMLHKLFEETCDNVTEWRCVIRDVTEWDYQRRLNEALCDFFPGLLFAKKAAAEAEESIRPLSFVHVNKGLAESINHSKKELIGKDDTYPPFKFTDEQIQFFAEEDHFVLKTGIARKIPHEVFIDGTVLSTLKKRVLGPFGEDLVFGASSYVTDLEEEWIHADELFSLLLDRGDTLHVAARKICERANKLEDIVGGFDGVAVIQHDPGNAKMRMVAATPNEFWQDKAKEWADGASESVSGYVIHGMQPSFAWPDFANGSPPIRPVHEGVMSTVAVRIEGGNSVRGERTPPWGIISCVATSAQNQHDIARALRNLRRYANQIAKVLSISALLEADREAAGMLLSFIVTGHEVGAPINKASNHLAVIQEYQKRIRNLFSASRQQLPAKALEERVINALSEMSNASVLLSVNLRTLYYWQVAAKHLGRFIQEQKRQGNNADTALLMERMNIAKGARMVNVSEAVAKLASEQERRPTDDASGVRLVRDVTEDLFIQCDEVLLQSVIHNILRNAVAYSGEEPRSFLITKREKEIFVSLKEIEGGVQLEVKNRQGRDERRNGNLSKLRRFFEEGNIVTDSSPGWGSVVILLIVQLHKGTVKVEIDDASEQVKVTVRLAKKLQ